MTELIFIAFFFGLGFVIGAAEQADTYQRRCEAKYADMPHNKVADHCKAILKFDQDAK